MEIVVRSYKNADWYTCSCFQLMCDCLPQVSTTSRSFPLLWMTNLASGHSEEYDWVCFWLLTCNFSWQTPTCRRTTTVISHQEPCSQTHSPPAFLTCSVKSNWLLFMLHAVKAGNGSLRARLNSLHMSVEKECLTMQVNCQLYDIPYKESVQIIL